jgi:hypothetical protein
MNLASVDDFNFLFECITYPALIKMPIKANRPTEIKAIATTKLIERREA